jgi:hypothetical protein
VANEKRIVPETVENMQINSIVCQLVVASLGLKHLNDRCLISFSPTFCVSSYPNRECYVPFVYFAWYC